MPKPELEGYWHGLTSVSRVFKDAGFDLLWLSAAALLQSNYGRIKARRLNAGKGVDRRKDS